MQVQPYLFFDGRCQEAAEFYRSALGAEITMLMRFKDAPPSDDAPGEGCVPTPGSDEKVMHMSMTIGDTTIMASDGMCQGKPEFQGISLSLSVADDDAARKTFERLAQGGQIQQPLIKTFFSSSFGMVADRFGVSWMIVVADPNAAA